MSPSSLAVMTTLHTPISYLLLALLIPMLDDCYHNHSVKQLKKHLAHFVLSHATAFESFAASGAKPPLQGMIISFVRPSI